MHKKSEECKTGWARGSDARISAWHTTARICVRRVLAVPEPLPDTRASGCDGAQACEPALRYSPIHAPAPHGVGLRFCAGSTSPAVSCHPRFKERFAPALHRGGSGNEDRRSVEQDFSGQPLLPEAFLPRSWEMICVHGESRLLGQDLARL